MAAGDSGDHPSVPRRPIDGRALALLRAYSDLSQTRLEVLTGIKRQKLAKIEKNEVAMEPNQRAVIAQALRVPEFVFDDLSEVVGYIDRIVGAGTFWGGDRRDWASAVVGPGEFGEGTAASRRLQRREERARLADSMARSVKGMVLGLFDAIDGGTYDEL